jgi:predicted RecA/RadA family phage recombinase
VNRRSFLALAAVSGLASPLGSNVEGLSVKSRGAIGDGRSHPLSERFHTLDAARAIYPHASALTQEVDWAATQGAINELARSPFGGIVFVPPGRYRMDAELVLPNLDAGDDAFNGVELRGAGPRSSVLHWPGDLGTGRFALRAAGRTTPDPHGYQRTQISDLTFYGPRLQDGLGKPPAQMSGLGITSRFVLRRVEVFWFRAGVDIWRDHSALHDCDISKNYYGAYWSGGTDSFGDHYFSNVDLAGNVFASIAVAPDNGIDHCTFISCHMGFSPYGIVGEEGPPTRTFLSNNKWIDCAFEACGNGWILGGKGSRVFGNIFMGCSYSNVADYRLPGRPYAAIIKATGLENNLFLGGTASFGYDAKGIVEAAVVVDDLVDNRFDDGRQLVTGHTAEVPSFRAVRASGNTFQAQRFSGFFMPIGQGGIETGELVQRDYDRARRLVPGGTPMGVAVGAGPASSIVPIATEGIAPVRKTSPALLAGTVLQAGSPSSRAEAVSTGRPLIGTAASDAIAGSELVAVDLRFTLR